VSRPRELVLPITSVRRATPSTRYVRLALNGTRFAFRAGQAAMIGLADSDQRVPYSIASSPEEARQQDAIEFLIKIEPSGRWGHKFDRLARGQEVALDGPMGSFVLDPGARRRPLLFIAGGTGIAPVRSMIRDALRHRHERIHLLYSARTSDGFAYASELRRLARRSLIEMQLHVTREAPKGWRGERGRITPGHIAALVQNPATLCFVCGPAAMVEDAPVMLRQAGVPRRNITLEKWGS
jgi:glycine betaine catabolism B